MFELVKNEQKYCEFIRHLRTDERIQEYFVEQVQITPEQQEAYMAKHNDEYYVCLTHLIGIDYTVPIGFIGVVNYDIRVAVIPEMQGKGVGRFMLNEIKQNSPLAIGKVKHQNWASMSLFTKCGYNSFMQDEEFIYYRIINK